MGKSQKRKNRKQREKKENRKRGKQKAEKQKNRRKQGSLFASQSESPHVKWAENQAQPAS